MSSQVVESAVAVADEQAFEMTLTKGDLVERLGPAFGQELFARIDEQCRTGEVVAVSNVRDARGAFSTARTPGRARIVKAQRTGKSGEPGASEEMLLIGMVDLAEMVKAATDFDWAAAFAPRHDLPTASTPAVIRPGARGQRLKL